MCPPPSRTPKPPADSRRLHPELLGGCRDIETTTVVDTMCCLQHVLEVCRRPPRPPIPAQGRHPPLAMPMREDGAEIFEMIHGSTLSESYAACSSSAARASMRRSLNPDQ